MALSEKDIDYIAELARLELTDEEKTRALKDVNSVLDYMKKLNELDTDNVSETSHMKAEISALRDDIVKESAPYREIVRNAPKEVLDHFGIPKIIS
jgi:aspartyl-tRNA(Asn)/glutamyl-tRNA(Gln) amidotransferase subunit C